MNGFFICRVVCFMKTCCFICFGNENRKTGNTLFKNGANNG